MVDSYCTHFLLSQINSFLHETWIGRLRINKTGRSYTQRDFNEQDNSFWQSQPLATDTVEFRKECGKKQL